MAGGSRRPRSNSIPHGTWAHLKNAVDTAVHDFVANEVFRMLDDDHKAVLTRLAVAPALDQEVVRIVFGEDALERCSPNLRSLGSSLRTPRAWTYTPCSGHSY